MSEGSSSASNDALFARLLFDMMLPAELAAAMQTQGYDVAEARTLPPEVQQDDWAILATAVEQRRVLVTCNYSDPRSNFVLIHEEWQAQDKSHAGILLIPQYQISDRRQRWDVRDRLLNFLNRYTWDELYNQLRWLPQEEGTAR